MLYSYSKQRGVSTLLISTIFLLVMGVMALTVNRSTLTENKMSSNEYRNIQAQQSAQAGVEVFIAQMKNATITTSAIDERNNATNFDSQTSTVSGLAKSELTIAGTGNLNYKVYAIKDTKTNPAKPVIYLTSYGYADCDDAGANCQTNVKINARMEYEQGAAQGSTPAILSVNGNVQSCGTGQTGSQCSSIHAYKNTYAGNPSYTDEAITYGGQINGKDSLKDVNGRDTFDGANTTVYGADAQGPTTDKTGAKDVGTMNKDAYFEQFFGDTKSNIKGGSTTTQITPGELKNYRDSSKIPERGKPAADGTKAKPPILWVNGDVNVGDFGSFWNQFGKDVIVIVDGNITLSTESHGAQVGFLYATGNVNAGEPNKLAGSWDFYGALAVEGSLTANTSFGLRPQKNPNDLLNSFKKPSSDIKLTNGNWSDF